MLPLWKSVFSNFYMTWYMSDNGLRETVGNPSSQVPESLRLFLAIFLMNCHSGIKIFMELHGSPNAITINIKVESILRNS